MRNPVLSIITQYETVQCFHALHFLPAFYSRQFILAGQNLFTVTLTDAEISDKTSVEYTYVTLHYWLLSSVLFCHVYIHCSQRMCSIHRVSTSWPGKIFQEFWGDAGAELSRMLDLLQLKSFSSADFYNNIQIRMHILLGSRLNLCSQLIFVLSEFG